MMSRTLSQIDSTTSHLLLPQLVYFPPFHIILCVYITIQNSLVIFHYRKDLKRLSSLLFILIAAADMGNAISGFGRNILDLLCVTNIIAHLQCSIATISFKFGLFCYAISIFLGVVLTVVKTINIVNPFYRLNKRAVHVTICLFCFVYFALDVSDCYFSLMGVLNMNEAGVPAPHIFSSCGTLCKSKLSDKQLLIYFFRQLHLST